MTQTTAPRSARAIRLGPLEFDEERWRKLHALAEADRRDALAYLNIVAEQHIDRRYPQLERRRRPAA